ncbi:MAG: type II toxin-antitoxin system VapC family toxin [Candidatus Omnitrophica bacterium]|nr:type II toxin-antitoxin system VapC family toxin [Candidatus Omnitrophota bacterium]
MIFDTDIFIWIQRGHVEAARLVSKDEERLLSIQTYMELLQGATNPAQHDTVKSFIKDFDFRTLPLTENIGHRAAVYIEEYALRYGLRVGDAIIAATAAEQNLVLCTSNAKHFRPIRELQLKVFKP